MTYDEAIAKWGSIKNPADERDFYILLGSDVSDREPAFGYYRSTNPDGTLNAIRDDTEEMVRLYQHGPAGEGVRLASGFRWILEDELQPDKP